MRFSTAIFLLLLTAVSGCYSMSSLDRTPRKKTTVKKIQQSPRINKNRSPQKNSDDPLFDAVFRRKPQNFDQDTSLSDAEIKALRSTDMRNDPELKKMHERNQKSDAKRKDWVFGTENGSFL